MPSRRSSSNKSSGAPSSIWSRAKVGTSTAPRKSAPPPAKASAPAPATIPAASSLPPAMAPQGGGMMSGIGGAIVSGMAMGTGSAIAHRAVDAVAGPRKMVVEHVDEKGEPVAAASASSAPMGGGAPSCGFELQAFQQCLTDNQGNAGLCKHFFDSLSFCQRGGH